MPAPDLPLVYFILGAPGSGRREVLIDLIEGGLAEGDRPAVLLESTEPADPAEARLPGLARWRWRDGVIDAKLPPDATHVFLIGSGTVDPVDQVEALPSWLKTQGAVLGRILCVVHCALAERNPALLAWYEACIHFSDVVLLNRREGVANKWISGFRRHFEKQFYPCLFETAKGGRVRNPVLVLEPEARRISQVFDAEATEISELPEGIAISGEPESEEETESEFEPDPYFARDAARRRQRRIPDIAKYLEPRN